MKYKGLKFLGASLLLAGLIGAITNHQRSAVKYDDFYRPSSELLDIKEELVISYNTSTEEGTIPVFSAITVCGNEFDKLNEELATNGVENSQAFIDGFNLMETTLDNVVSKSEREKLGYRFLVYRTKIITQISAIDNVISRLEEDSAVVAANPDYEIYVSQNANYLSVARKFKIFVDENVLIGFDKHRDAVFELLETFETESIHYGFISDNFELGELSKFGDQLNETFSGLDNSELIQNRELFSEISSDLANFEF